MELERRVRISLQEDGMTGLIVIDITAALDGDEDTRVWWSSFREGGFRIGQVKLCELVPEFFRAAEPQSHIHGHHMSISMTNLQSVQGDQNPVGGEEMLNITPSPIHVLNHLTSTLTSCSHSSIVLPLAYEHVALSFCLA